MCPVIVRIKFSCPLLYWSLKERKNSSMINYSQSLLASYCIYLLSILLPIWVRIWMTMSKFALWEH